MNEPLNRAVKALKDLKLTDIRIYDFRGVSPFYDFQVLSTGQSERQVQSSVRRIIDALPDRDTSRIEGAAEGRWILFDLGDLIVNVLHKEEREYYQLEKLFVEREEIDPEALEHGI
jgi:ribosome-associated protein